MCQPSDEQVTFPVELEPTILTDAQNEVLDAASKIAELLKEKESWLSMDSMHIRGRTSKGWDALDRLAAAVDAMEE